MKRANEILVKGVPFLHIATAARLLVVSKATIRSACRTKIGDCEVMGGAWYINKTSLRAFLRKSQEVKAAKNTEVKSDRRRDLRKITLNAKGAARLGHL